MNFEDAVRDFGDAIERKAATVLVGAGLSQGAGYPGWAALLGPFFGEFATTAEEFTDLPLLAQYVVGKDGNRERLIRTVVEGVNAVRSDPSSDQHLVVELPVDEVWTTNYDPQLEIADPSFDVVEIDEHFVRRGKGRRRLNKMHGSINRETTGR